MKKLFKTILLIASLPLILCCDNDNDPTNNVCEDTYVTDAIVTAFSAANGFNPISSIDLITHEYEIQINTDGEICSVGYKNSPTYTGNYKMQVINVTSGSSYSGLHTFSQVNLDYQSITPPIAITSGDVVKVKRTIQPGFIVFQDEIGDVITSNNATLGFPITQGNVTFLASNFYGTGGPLTDFAIPIIGLGFKVN